ncbi:hypothetical protein A8B75_06425 [Sphingomonadales bacterium EhC05]|nr:hypothetical protein A8B75_06425 [Sphingomonadales bacterium EhC05]
MFFIRWPFILGIRVLAPCRPATSAADDVKVTSTKGAPEPLLGSESIAALAVAGAIAKTLASPAIKRVFMVNNSLVSGIHLACPTSIWLMDSYHFEGVLAII